MKTVTQTNSPGWIKKKFHDFGMGEMFAPLAVDRLEEDDALLSKALIDLHVLHHYPLIRTAKNVMSVVAAADQVTLGDNIVFAVGGVVFSTHDQERTFVIPDNSTKFLRAEVDSTCGDLVACASTQDGTCMTPLARKQVCAFTITEGAETDPEGIGGGVSSPTSMRILKVVKGAGGSVPVVTLYTNDGHDLDASVAAHEAKDPAHPARNISFDNTTAQLEGAPTRVQTAIEALLARAATTEVQGLIELATDAEVAALTDAERAITSSNLGKLFARSLSPYGYQVLPGGLIIQWGSFTSSASSAGAICTFPVAFSDRCYAIICSDIGSTCVSYAAYPLSASQFTLWGKTSGAYYVGSCFLIAVGR
jgi:hypothetical protein